MSKKIKIIFTLSFLLNIIFIGALIGGLYKSQKGNPMSSMDDNVQKIIKKNMDENRDNMRVKFDQMKDLKSELKIIVEAENFDKSAFDKQMSQILKIKSDMGQGKADSLAKTLSELSQEDRKSFSNNVLRLLNGRGRGGHKGSKHKHEMSENPD